MALYLGGEASDVRKWWSVWIIRGLPKTGVQKVVAVESYQGTTWRRRQGMFESFYTASFAGRLREYSRGCADFLHLVQTNQP